MLIIDEKKSELKKDCFMGGDLVFLRCKFAWLLGFMRFEPGPRRFYVGRKTTFYPGFRQALVTALTGNAGALHFLLCGCVSD